MILIVYVLVKLFIKKVLIEKNFSANQVTKNSVKKNFKIISSIFYWEIIDIIKENAIINQFTDSKENLNDKDNKQIKKGNQNQDKNIERTLKEGIKKVGDDKYIELTNKLQNHKKIINSEMDKVEKDILIDVNKNLEIFYPDSKENSIEFLESEILSKKILNNYYSLAKKNGFDLKSKIKSWGKQIKNLVNS